VFITHTQIEEIYRQAEMIPEDERVAHQKAQDDEVLLLLLFYIEIVVVVIVFFLCVLLLVCSCVFFNVSLSVCMCMCVYRHHSVWRAVLQHDVMSVMMMMLLFS